MSVLIKGLIMPICCDGCTFSAWSNLHQTASCKLHDYAPCFADHSREYTDKRAEFCPLVEIPEHGRLIDADYLKEHIIACATNERPLYNMELSELLETIDDVPTVIEAEE